MPIYEYHCKQCGAREELLESMSAPESHACFSCGQAEGMRRQMSVPALATAPSPSSSSVCGPSGCGTGACPFA